MTHPFDFLSLSALLRKLGWWLLFLNLLIDEIHEPSGDVPARITHFFVGSAGRKGTCDPEGG